MPIKHYNAQGQRVDERGRYTSDAREAFRAEEQQRLDQERAAFWATGRRHPPTNVKSNMTKQRADEFPVSDDERKAQFLKDLGSLWQMADALERDGKLTRREAEATRQIIMADQVNQMSSEQFTALRESGAWPLWENRMRKMPDGVSSHDYEKFQERAGRKLMAQVNALGYLHGFFDENEALARLKQVVKVQETGGGKDEIFTRDQSTLIDAVGSVLDPQPHLSDTVEFADPGPQGRLPEHLTDAHMEWTPREYERPNSPSARARMREETASLKARRPGTTDKEIRDGMDAAHKAGITMTRYVDEKPAPKSSHPMSVAGPVHYPGPQETPATPPPAAPGGGEQS
jgi:hypothetical protein